MESFYCTCRESNVTKAYWRHIASDILSNFVSDNILEHVQSQLIIWNNADLLLIRH